ncbi:hypothetical protein H9P43_007036 [Blastocladiella emersonii ATCC 22665]|nr:hypothetical protein H9P43_007036 [Blastocladiella emersonii ATCC 22665]
MLSSLRTAAAPATARALLVQRSFPAAAAMGLRAHSTLPDASAKKQRPLSPHLTIYNWNITNTLSAAHRVTGAATGALVYLAAWAAAAGAGSSDLVAAAASLPSAVFVLGKAAVIAPTMFHSFNGIRHLYWDSGRALSLKGVYQTGYAVVGATVVSTIGLLLW